ncbi:MAG: serine/threonine-protein kinase [Lysobacterales bacterium]
MQAPIEIPNFELIDELGRGGMARVYLANQLQPKRKVAIKIVAPTTGQDDSFMESLKLEGDMAAQCSHANIVTVYACGVVDHHYYLAMELLSGGDLTAKIKRGINADEALEILKDMAGALDHAHSIKLLHRDIKPENIMFHESGKAVLVDFGIAKEQDTESNFTKAGAVVGTPHYMSPERATGKAIDFRSDLYALGVVFYEMLTGNKLFEGADTFAISYAHVYEPIPMLPEPYVKYQPLLNRLVAKEPDSRFQSAGELLAALNKPASVAAMDPANSATIAVAPSELASQVEMKAAQADAAPAIAPDAAREATADKAKSGLPLVPIIAIAATVAVAAVVGINLMGGEEPSNGSGQSGAIPIGLGQNLDVAERERMQELLAAAASMSRINNYEQAEANLFKVLSEFDCKNEEARRGLQALNPTRAEEIIQICDGR